MSARRRRAGRLAAVAVDAARPVEDAAIREVARRDIAAAIVRHGGDCPVPDVDPQVEAIAAEAKRRRPTPPPDVVEAQRARLLRTLLRLRDEEAADAT